MLHILFSDSALSRSTTDNFHPPVKAKHKDNHQSKKK